MNYYGKGQVYYIASDPEERFSKDFVSHICYEKGIRAPFAVKDGVEIMQRHKENQVYTFFLNHNDHEVKIGFFPGRFRDLLKEEEVAGEISLQPNGVVILEHTI